MYRKPLKNASNVLRQRAVLKKAENFQPRMHLGFNFGRPSMLPGAPGRTFWRPVVPSKTFQVLLGRPGDALEHSRDALGTPVGHQEVSRDGSRIDFQQIWDPSISPAFKTSFEGLRRPSK